ncbi:MAG: hypothetical protein M3O01_11225 [Pseudomonadota bacterium]|nr:hypothetical protein [Pseudomonadota bacterium]
MTLPNIPSSMWWLVVPLVGWRVVARLRKLVARQRFSIWRQAASVGGLLTLTVGVGVVAGLEHSSVDWLGAGLLLGASLGAWAYRATEFERRPEGLYFTPDRYLGVALSAILVGRVLWRLIKGAPDAAGWSLDDLVRNSSTLFLFGLYAGHFIVYSSGLIFRGLPRWHHRPPA